MYPFFGSYTLPFSLGFSLGSSEGSTAFPFPLSLRVGRAVPKSKLINQYDLKEKSSRCLPCSVDDVATLVTSSISLVFLP